MEKQEPKNRLILSEPVYICYFCEAVFNTEKELMDHSFECAGYEKPEGLWEDDRDT